MQKDHKILLYFLALWTIINCLQAYFTELAYDEAYYWVWSKHLNWGFYEHPPLVALLIKAGYWLLQNELGVRLAAVLSSSFVLYVIYVELIKKNVRLYLAIVFSMFLIHAGGFLTAPDTPLFISTALFFVFAKRYISQDNPANSFLLLISVVFMIYSKYHASLVLLFAVLGYLKALKRKSFWTIVVLSALAYLPHLHWLFTEGEEGLNYALSGRFANELKLENVLGYVSGQVLVTGPLIGFVLFYAFIKIKPNNDYEKLLKRTAIGIFSFFFLWSFKGRIEANWTATAFIPLIYLSHKYLSENKKLSYWCYRLAIPSILLLLVFRVDLMLNVFPESFVEDKRKEFHGWKEFATKMDSIAGDLPILTARYQEASKLWFYRQKLSIPFNSLRPNAFDSWEYDKKLKDKRVAVLYNYIRKDYSIIQTPLGSSQFKVVDSFRSYSEASVVPILKQKQYKSNDTINLQVRVIPPKDWAIIGKGRIGIPTFLTYNIIDAVTVNTVKYDEGQVWLQDSVVIPEIFNMEVIMPKKPGKYNLQTQLSSKGFVTWWCKENYPIEVVR